MHERTQEYNSVGLNAAERINQVLSHRILRDAFSFFGRASLDQRFLKHSLTHAEMSTNNVGFACIEWDRDKTIVERTCS